MADSMIISEREDHQASDEFTCRATMNIDISYGNN